MDNGTMVNAVCTCDPDRPGYVTPGCPVCSLSGVGPWYDLCHATFDRRRIFAQVDEPTEAQAYAILRAVLTVDNDSIPF